MSNIKEAFQRFCSIALSVTTTVWLSGLTLLLPVYPVLAVAPADYGLTEGDLIRAPSLPAPDGWKVYIINQAGYKRHIFNPDVFNMYGHLKWENIKDVSADVVNAFTISDLYRADGDPKVWSVDENGVKHWINMTAEDFVAQGYKWEQIFLVNATEGNYYTQGSDIITGVTPAPAPAPVSGALSVELAATTPAAGILAGGTVFNNALTLRLTAGSADASVTALTVTKSGLLANTLISGISVWKGDARQGNILTSLTSDGKASFTFGTSITVPANSTVDLDIKANISSTATSGTFNFFINSASDVSAGGTVSGTFPVTGNTFSIVGSGAIGSYTVTAQSVGGNTSSTAAGNLEIGTAQKEVGKFQFNETTGREDMMVKQLTIYVEGSVQAADLNNWKLYSPEGTELATGTVAMPYVTFALATSYSIPEGTNRVLSIKVDPVDGADRTMRVHIQNDYDMLVQGKETGAFIAPSSFSDQAASDGYFRLKQGALTVSLTAGSPSGNIAVGATEAVLAKFDLRAVGEQLEIRKMDIEIVEASSSTSEQLTGNVKVQSDDGLSTYLSLSSDTANLQRTSDTTESTRFDLNTYIVIPSGTTKTIKVMGTVKTTATAVQTYKAKIGNFFVWRASTKDFTDLLAASYTSGNTLTVQTSALTVARNASIANKSVAIGANDVVLGSFVFQAGAAEGVSISAMTVTYSADPSAELTNISLWANGVQFGTTVGTPSATSDAFTGTLSIDPSQTATVEVKGNVRTSVSANDTIQMRISSVSATGKTTSNSITATNPNDDDSDGSTGESLANDPTRGQTITYASGSLTITKEGAPTSKIVVAGTTGVDLNKVKFEALNDTLTLNKVRFETSLNGSTTAGGGKYIKKAYLYDGTTNLTTNGIIPVPSGDSAEMLFDGLSVSIPAGSSKSLTLKVDLSDYAVITAASDIGTFAVQVKSDGTTDNLQVVGTQGNLVAANINGSGTDSDIAPSDNFLFHATQATATNVSLTSTSLTPSSNQEVFKFTVGSSNSAVSLRLGKIQVNASISPVNGWTGTVGTWDLYEGDTRIAQNTSLTLSSSTTSGVLTFDNTNDISSLFDEGATSAEITSGTNGRLVDSSGKTYNIKVSTTAIKSSSSATPGNAYLTLKIDGLKGYSTATGTSTDPNNASATATSTEDNWTGGGVYYAYKIANTTTYIGGTANAGGFNASDSYPATGQTLTY